MVNLPIVDYTNLNESLFYILTILYIIFIKI